MVTDVTVDQPLSRKARLPDDVVALPWRNVDGIGLIAAEGQNLVHEAEVAIGEQSEGDVHVHKEAVFGKERGGPLANSLGRIHDGRLTPKRIGGA